MSIKQPITEMINDLSKKSGYIFLNGLNEEELGKLAFLIEGNFLNLSYGLRKAAEQQKKILRRCVKRTIDDFCDEGRRSISLLDDIKINLNSIKDSYMP